jgi:copper(I)-binding protein
MKKIFSVLAAALMGMSALTACSSSDSATPEIVVSGAYARATDEMSFSEATGTYMTGVFMTITNNSDSDVVLETGKSEQAPMIEVHEVVDGVMRKKEGGLIIKAGSSEDLKPGGNHVMLMGMTNGLAAGSEVAFTLVFSDGTELEIKAPVKVVNLEQEHYHSGSPAPSMSGM